MFLQKKAKYTRYNNTGGNSVPVMKEVIRNPIPESKPLNKQQRTRNEEAQLKKAGFVTREYAPATVLDKDGEETEKGSRLCTKVTAVVYTMEMVKPKNDMKNEFAFARTFRNDGEFAVGVMDILPQKQKPNGSTGIHSLVSASE